MMLEYSGSIFDSEAQTLVAPVNCVGVMGAGLAKTFSLRFPDMVAPYKSICSRGFRPGELRLWKGEDKWVLLFPTKDHWKDPSRLEWINAGLLKFRERYSVAGITGIAFPMLGAGLGGLEKSDVMVRFNKYLGDLRDVRISIYI